MAAAGRWASARCISLRGRSDETWRQEALGAGALGSGLASRHGPIFFPDAAGQRGYSAPALSLSAEILSYINALKWPVVIAGATYYFRRPVFRILDRVSTSQKGAISGPAGTSISWDDTLRQVDAAVEDAQSEALERLSPGKPPKEDEESRLRHEAERPAEQWASVNELLSVSPEAAVLMAFAEVEQSLRTVAQQQGVVDVDRMGMRQLARQVQLPDDVQQALQQLSSLRNAVAHRAAHPDQDAAKEYVESAKGLDQYLTLFQDLFRRD